MLIMQSPNRIWRTNLQLHLNFTIEAVLINGFDCHENKMLLQVGLRSKTIRGAHYVLNSKRCTKKIDDCFYASAMVAVNSARPGNKCTKKQAYRKKAKL